MLMYHRLRLILDLFHLVECDLLVLINPVIKPIKPNVANYVKYLFNETK